MATRRSMSDAKTVLSPSKRLFALISEPGIREYRSVDLLDIAHEMADVEFALAASQARVVEAEIAREECALTVRKLSAANITLRHRLGYDDD